MKASVATELIGNTPIVPLRKIASSCTNNANCVIWAKVEKFNLGGSIKDRIALSMVLDAEQRGALKPGGTILEATSGNTGIGLSLVGVQRGYKVVLTMAKSVSVERRKLLKAYGAELILVDGGTGGAVKKAVEVAKEHPEYFYVDQFSNPSNFLIHEKTTGPEILRAFADSQVDAFVAGVGTGGTITGVGHVLRNTYGNAVHIAAVEPAASPVLSGGPAGPHGIQVPSGIGNICVYFVKGIGAGFVPAVLDTKIYNEIIKIEDKEAMAMMTRIGAEEGLHVGISSGAAVVAALKLAEKVKPRADGKPYNIVVVLPDTGERYLSLLSE